MRLSFDTGSLSHTLSAPAACYVTYVRAGSVVFLSGHLSKKNGAVWVGQLGATLNTSEGKDAARAVAVDLLATLHAATGDLNKVKRIVKMLSLINSTANSTEQHLVTNAASELLAEVFA